MTMRLPIYQIDAFASAVFKGNPAAVVPLESWLPDATLQAIAAENNLAETAFFVREDGGWALRWFTPVVEVDLCGHATLATAHLIFSRLAPGLARARFTTRSGVLEVSKQGELLALDFPSRPTVRVEDDGRTAAALAKALGRKPAEVWKSRDTPLAVYETAAEVVALKPDMTAVTALDVFAVNVTAPGGEPGVDFVSRFFAPAKGIPEDPVTGSAHCTLIPFWAKRLGRPKLMARQVSARGGELTCEDRGERVSIAGHAVLYLEGAIHI
jgi:PhzF family phenazine biosynthesis protein